MSAQRERKRNNGTPPSPKLLIPFRAGIRWNKNIRPWCSWLWLFLCV